MGELRLNCQGLARKSKSLMSAFVAPPGWSFISSDAGAAEPSVITHYSKDPMYYQAAFGMVGKEPFYREDNLLMIDDIYLQGASYSPMAKDKMRDAFNTKWNGKTFQEQWLEDSEVIKDALKNEFRALHKIAILGIGYGMGPKKMVQSAYEAGYIIQLKDARIFWNRYWDTYKEVARLRDFLSFKFKKEGRLINDFGFRLTPDEDRKALNYWIQSSVTGLMHVFTNLLYRRGDLIQFVTVIHDELISQVPDNKLVEAKVWFDQCVVELNQMLGWDINMRFGWKVGKNLYEAH